METTLVWNQNFHKQHIVATVEQYFQENEEKNVWSVILYSAKLFYSVLKKKSYLIMGELRSNKRAIPGESMREWALFKQEMTEEFLANNLWWTLNT